jgi:MFS family permease
MMPEPQAPISFLSTRRGKVQSLQWVVSGYLLTYGGFLLLGGRAADLTGRRRILVAGTVLFGASSPAWSGALRDRRLGLTGAA